MQTASSPFVAPRTFLETLFRTAVKAADPSYGLRQHLPRPPKGRTVVVGAGKGAAQMAAALESLWQGPLSGVVVTRYGYGCPLGAITLLEAGHPVPDEAGLHAAACLKAAVAPLGEDDLVIALICGGGSALLPAPPEGMTLADEIAVNEALLASGAPISAMNVVRKHLSTIKGGRLAALTKAPVVTFILSDIPGDNPAHVASGPTVPDHSTRQQALEIVKTYDLDLPQVALDHLASPAADAPLPDAPVFYTHRHHVIASAGLSLTAAAEAARAAGVEAVILSDSIEGEARDIARMHGAIAREIVLRDRPFRRPVLVLSGGETTVTIRQAAGRGGRNSEFALALALDIAGLPVTALAADTDGIDGSQDNAGAFVDGETLARLRSTGLDPRAILKAHDSYAAFDALGDLFVTGPTGTNVNDFRALLIV
ncbi:glycerate kinase [Allorhizobium sp. BGMRC 0089]|uniref:glycerate kinase type-2 family protein n=1 Tax=Allorhizobium sonneratiae TaxID=2934936 RepID=UPI002033B55E|nr:glycerate kinase [Allorhizobium sonneratiae]